MVMTCRIEVSYEHCPDTDDPGRGRAKYEVARQYSLSSVPARGEHLCDTPFLERRTNSHRSIIELSFSRFHGRCATSKTRNIGMRVH